MKIDIGTGKQTYIELNSVVGKNYIVPEGEEKICELLEGGKIYYFKENGKYFLRKLTNEEEFKTNMPTDSRN